MHIPLSATIHFSHRSNVLTLLRIVDLVEYQEKKQEEKQGQIKNRKRLTFPMLRTYSNIFTYIILKNRLRLLLHGSIERFTVRYYITCNIFFFFYSFSALFYCHPIVFVFNCCRRCGRRRSFHNL